MLEKFTPEEIAQLKKELKELTSGEQKLQLVEDAIEKVYELPKREGDSPYLRGYYSKPRKDIRNSLLALCDMTLANYTLKMRKTKNDTHSTEVYSRRTGVPAEMANDYKEMCGRLVAIVAEYWDKGNKNAKEGYWIHG